MTLPRKQPKSSIFLVLFFCTGCASTVTESPIVRTPEHNLAIIQAHDQGLPASDPTVDKFGRILDRLEKRSKNSREEIADIIVRAQDLLEEKKGIKRSALDIAQDLDKTTTGLGKAHLDLREVAAALITLTAKN